MEPERLLEEARRLGLSLEPGRAAELGRELARLLGTVDHAGRRLQLDDDPYAFASALERLAGSDEDRTP